MNHDKSKIKLHKIFSIALATIYWPLPWNAFHRERTERYLRIKRVSRNFYHSAIYSTNFSFRFIGCECLGWVLYNHLLNKCNCERPRGDRLCLLYFSSAVSQTRKVDSVLYPASMHNEKVKWGTHIGANCVFCHCKFIDSLNFIHQFIDLSLNFCDVY